MVGYRGLWFRVGGSFPSNELEWSFVVGGREGELVLGDEEMCRWFSCWCRSFPTVLQNLGNSKYGDGDMKICHCILKDFNSSSCPWGATWSWTLELAIGANTAQTDSKVLTPTLGIGCAKAGHFLLNEETPNSGEIENMSPSRSFPRLKSCFAEEVSLWIPSFC